MFLVAVEAADEGERLIGMVGITRAGGYRALVVETTPRQTGAAALFRHLGFQDAGRSMIGRFELVWFTVPPGTTD